MNMPLHAVRTYVAACVVSLAASALGAAAVTFPGEGGDLSLASEWGGSIPASDDLVTIASNGTYVASTSDLAYGALAVAATNVTFDFSATPTRKVVFDGSDASPLTVNTALSRTLFKCGTWCCADGTTCNFLCGGSSTHAHDHEVFLDNCVWTNLNRVYIGYHEARCKLTLDNASRVYAKQCFVEYGPNHIGDELYVLGGSALHLSDSTNPFYSDNSTTSLTQGSGKIVVAGEGSLMSAPNGSFLVGNTHSDIHLVVSKHASFAAKDFYLGFQASAYRSRALVSDGASFTADKIIVRGTDAGMVVSNAALTVTSTAKDAVTVGQSGREGESFVISGASSSLDFSPVNWCEVFAAKARRAEFRIDNGASVNLPNSARFAADATNCVFRIDSGGEFSLNDGAQTFEFGPGSNGAAPTPSVSNRIEVCDGGKLRFGELRLNGTGNALVVSNASVICDTASRSYMYIGYRYFKWAEGVTPTNCAIVLRGNTAKIYAPQTQISLYHGSTLRIEVPEGGYADGFVPIEAYYLSSDGNGNKLEIDCEEFAAKTGGKLTLMQVVASQGLTSAAVKAMIEAVAATLPEKCTLSYADKKLTLKCPRRGTIVIVM